MQGDTALRAPRPNQDLSPAVLSFSACDTPCACCFSEPVLRLLRRPRPFAQGEAELRDFFEGKSVRVKMDMPATQQGIDVYPDARRPINFEEYSARVKASGISIRTGDSVIVTRVRLKDKIIEFQLAGGGYGTFGDDTSGSVYTPSTPKSNREKDLEKLDQGRDQRHAEAAAAARARRPEDGPRPRGCYGTRPPRRPPRKPRRRASPRPGCTADRVSTCAIRPRFRRDSDPTA